MTDTDNPQSAQAIKLYQAEYTYDGRAWAGTTYGAADNLPHNYRFKCNSDEEANVKALEHLSEFSSEKGVRNVKLEELLEIRKIPLQK